MRSQRGVYFKEVGWHADIDGAKNEGDLPLGKMEGSALRAVGQLEGQ